MLDIYGLAAVHLGEWQRQRDDAKARYDRGPATVAVRQAGVIRRLQALLRQGARNRAARSARAAEDRTGGSGCGCVAAARGAA